MIKTLSYAFIFLISITLLFSQEGEHTLSGVSAMPDDSLKVKAWMALGKSEGKNNYAIAEAYADSAVQLSKHIGYLNGWAAALNEVGQAAMKQSKYDLAMQAYERAYHYYDSVGFEQKKARILNNMSFVKRDLADYEEAISILFDALKIYEEIKDTAGIANAYTNIAVAHAIKQDLDFAEEYFTKALEMFRAIDKQRNVHTLILNLAGLNTERGNYDKALELLNEALIYFKREGPKQEEARTYYVLGNMFLSKGELDKSETNYWRSKTIFDSVGNVMRSSGALLRMSSVAEQRGDIDKAIEYAKEVYAINLEAGLKNMSLRSTAQLASLYEQKADYSNALKYQKLVQAYSDTIYDEEKDTQIAELVEKYESEKSKQELSEAKAELELQDLKVKRQKAQQGILIGISISVFIILILVFLQLGTRKRNNQILKEKNAIINESLAEKEVLLKEIHHRVKNNLQFISSLLNLQSRHVSDPKTLSVLKEGKSRVQSMALVHQKLYQEENLKGVDMADYLKTLIDGLTHSYNIQDRLVIEQEVDRVLLDIDSAMPVGMIVNELIINAIKHAFKEGEKGKVNIELKKEEETLRLVVADDGIGLPEGFDLEQNDQFGLKLVQSLAEKLKADISMKTENGAKFQFIISNYKEA